ncbi:C40 family peptidase [Deinococcus taeanensis]|uniref:C40 family peptidase n=1 Tax=Deinococcus taeanensis TaxID=2737050 RepID=UPI001CDBFF88|nr:C40 family peptidase [Deinococcus taeanensis]UBV42056.1 C40 family peptidase [Deinococcus taeanensis]
MIQIRSFLPLLLTGALLVGGAGAQGAVTASAGDLRGQATVTVQVGDTAYSLARRAGLSVPELLTLNSLSSADLKVGQLLLLKPAPPQTYGVQPGDTLYGLARRAGVTVDALLAASNLPQDAVLKVGQVLTLPPGAALAPLAVGPAAPATTPRTLPAGGVSGSPFQPAAPAQVTPVLQPGAPMPGAQVPGAAVTTVLPDATSWRGAAMALLDTPYVFGGSSPTGTDCSGFVLQVFTPLGFSLPRTSAEQARVGQDVPLAELSAGDLVFFDTGGTGRVSHVGIYLGDDQFISANSYRGRVSVDRLSADRYWAPRFVGARRVLPGVVTAQSR